MSRSPPSINTEQSAITASLIVLFIIWPAQIALNNPWQWAIQVGSILFVAAAVMLVITGAIRFRMPRWLLVFTLLWLTAAGISAFWVGDLRVLQVYGSLLLVFFLVSALATNSSDSVRLVRYLIIGVVTGGVALMAISVAVEPFSLRRYQGIFNNPNNMGWFTAGLMHLMLGALYGNRLAFSRCGRAMLFMTLILAAIFLLASNSRAALGSVLAAGGILGLLLWSETVQLMRGRLRRNGVQKSVMALVIVLVAVALAWNAGLLIEIVAKFTEMHQRGDLSQGRLDAWLASLQHWTWLGHGPDYAVAIGRVGMTTGHSTWISHLSRYGLVNMLFLMLFLGFATWWAWRAARRGSHPIGVVMLPVVIGFAANATFETGTSTPGMWMTVILFAIGLQGLGGGCQWVANDRRASG